MSKINTHTKFDKVFKDIDKLGYSKIKLFTKKQINNFFKDQIIFNLNKKLTKKMKLNKHNLEYYHNLIKDEKVHKKLINPGTRQIKVQKDIINSTKNNKYIKNLIKKSWGQEIFDIRLYYKKSIKKNCAAFRMARPHRTFKNDVGGAHLDLHFNNKVYKNHKILFTIWIPVIGFNEKYTLRLSPKSHKKNHKLKYILNQSNYISKVFKPSYIKRFKFKRLNMQKGEVVIFHPNLLHGSSLNQGQITRASYDLRIYNRSLI